MTNSTVYYDRFGIRRTLHRDSEDPNRFAVETAQDVEPVLDSIARDREIMAQNGPMRLSHRIPTIIYEELQRRGITEDETEFRKWLNGPEGRTWRIWNGRV